jgi:predicted HTH domain antitoxin
MTEGEEILDKRRVSWDLFLKRWNSGNSSNSPKGNKGATMKTFPIKIPDDILLASRMTSKDISVELAVHLFETGKLSIGKAKSLAGMTLWTFQNLLASRKIPIHYGVEEYKEDLNTLRRLKRSN